MADAKHRCKRVYDRCFFCKGKVEEHFMTREYRWEGKLCFLEDVPLGVCSQCGVESIKDEVREAIERIFQEKRPPVKFMQVPMYTLQLDDDGVEQGKRDGRLETLPATIEFGISLRFGDEYLEDFMPLVRSIYNLEQLEIVKNAIKSVKDISELKALIVNSNESSFLPDGTNSGEPAATFH